MEFTEPGTGRKVTPSKREKKQNPRKVYDESGNEIWLNNNNQKVPPPREDRR